MATLSKEQDHSFIEVAKEQGVNDADITLVTFVVGAPLYQPNRPVHLACCSTALCKGEVVEKAQPGTYIPITEDAKVIIECPGDVARIILRAGHRQHGHGSWVRFRDAQLMMASNVALITPDLNGIDVCPASEGDRLTDAFGKCRAQRLLSARRIFGLRVRSNKRRLLRVVA